MRFYSEGGEDSILWQLFKRVYPYGEIGTFVDVGAMDGQWINNTLVFDKEGWLGVCVEPHPLYYDLLTHLRSSRSLCIWAAASDKDMDAIDFQMTHFGALSTIKRNQAELYKVAPWDKYYECSITVQVPAMTLDTIMERSYSYADFISIDVEGLEMEVLRGFTLAKYLPRVVLIEVIDVDNALANVDAYFAASGYVRGKEISTNRFYCREQADADFIRDLPALETNRLPHPLAKAISGIRGI